MKIAYLFPGQEPVMPNAGLELADKSPEARALLEHVAERTGVDIFRLLSRGGPQLERSAIMQPTLVAVSMGALLELSKAGIEPDMVAGLSLGEISAWAAAGCIRPEDAVDIAVLRGRVVGEVAKRNPGRLLSLHVQEEGDLEEAIQIGKAHGIVTVASVNSPDRVLLTGEESALRLVARRFSSTWLPMRGPYHSPLMEEAVAPVRAALEAVPRSPARAELVCNRTGRAIESYDDIPRVFAEQIIRPIVWTETLRTLSEAGVTDYVTVGPGKVLRALLRRNLGTGYRIHRTDDSIDIDETIGALSSP